MTESAPQLELRLRAAAQELRQAELFDRQVINSEDHLKGAVADIDATISAEKQRYGRTPILLL
jgi:guanylate kinase